MSKDVITSTRGRAKAPATAPTMAQTDPHAAYLESLAQQGQGGISLYKEIPDTAGVKLVTVHATKNGTGRYLTQGTFSCAIGGGHWDAIQDEEDGESFEMVLVIQEPILHSEEMLSTFMVDNPNRGNILSSYRRLIANNQKRFCAIAFE
jgi:hypothetical protein